MATPKGLKKSETQFKVTKNGTAYVPIEELFKNKEEIKELMSKFMDFRLKYLSKKENQN